ncbi:MAG TPA: dihydrodipicolinate synthase family protein [Verrucomicrobiae bacterium]|nr:dihydrodipicolinate synthase family protein [Verrucomicrobiae bacterium]
MKTGPKHGGVVVPMITPVTEDRRLDETAVDRLVDSLLTGGVDGIFVMGTTGEGTAIPQAYRQQFVERTVARVNGRARVFAGIGDAHPGQIAAGNDYFRAGVDAVVSRPPLAIPAEGLLPWFQALLDGLDGPLLLYNMPVTTKISIPLDVVENLAGHPRLAGIKDSENNPRRLEELLRRFGGKRDFSVFVGVGALMESGLRLGADGIVPSVGNLIPDVCRKLCDAARNGDWSGAGAAASRMNAVAALYQNGRSLNESLSVLKGALHLRGLCAPHVLPPLKPLTEAQLEKLRNEMDRMHLLNGQT